MPRRTKTDPTLRLKRVNRDIKVLKYLSENIDTLATGGLESPEKLTVFYAGYTAMRSIWEVKTDKGKKKTGDAKLDEEMKNETGKMIFRVNQEISHSIGNHSKTLLRIAPFKFWAKRVLRQWGNEKNA